jgi:hypothetical protein
MSHDASSEKSRSNRWKNSIGVLSEALENEAIDKRKAAVDALVRRITEGGSSASRT